MKVDFPSHVCVHHGWLGALPSVVFNLELSWWRSSYQGHCWAHNEGKIEIETRFMGWLKASAERSGVCHLLFTFHCAKKVTLSKPIVNRMGMCNPPMQKSSCEMVIQYITLVKIKSLISCMFCLARLSLV